MLAAGFAALGGWQVERLYWKRDLIAAVEARLAAEPVAPPAAWSEEDAYRRVAVDGVFRHEKETLVQAVTDHGPGFWVVTPLETGAGVILINRGFVPTNRRDPETRRAGQAAGLVHVEGLMRASEPHGAFLRSNAPGDGRWYSRDVAAIAEARGLGGAVAPYFIDAAAAPNPSGYPLGGLTVVRFRNSHLAYVLTWFGLSALSLGGAFIVWRSGARNGRA